MRAYEQEAHADLGLHPDGDRTEDLRRPIKGNAPGRCANTAEGLPNNPHTTWKDAR